MTNQSQTPADPPGRCTLITTPTTANLPRAQSGPTATTPDTGTGFVWVTDDGDPDAVLSKLNASPRTELPGSIDLISLSNCLRSTEPGTEPTTYPMNGTDLRVHELAEENSLTNLGMTIIECVTRLEASGTTPVIVFDEFETLLTTHTPREVFKFLHVLTGKCRGSNWQLQVRVDADESTTEQIETLQPLFDTIE